MLINRFLLQFHKREWSKHKLKLVPKILKLFWVKIMDFDRFKIIKKIRDSRLININPKTMIQIIKKH